MNVFITGGTTGLGAELAKLYLAEGHAVAVCGRRKEPFVQSFPNPPLTLHFYALDVMDADGMAAAVEDFTGRYGGELHLMVANAGISMGNKSQIPNFKRSKEVVSTNILGLMNSFEIGLNYMLKQRSGQLVGVASVAGFCGLPGAAAYSASKAAVLTFCESLSIDLVPMGIDVTVIAPGFVDTPLTRVNKHPMPFLMSSKKAGELMKKAIDKKRVLYVFPIRMYFIMTFLSLLPRTIYRFIMRSKIFNYSKKVHH